MCLCRFVFFSLSRKRKSRSEKSCGELRMLSQASAPVKPTTKSLSPLLPTQVRLLGLSCVHSKIYLLSVQCSTSHVVMLLYLTNKAINHILDTNALNISHGKRKHCLYSMCVFMVRVHVHWIPQRGSLCLQCRRHQCLLCLGARLLWRWDFPCSNSSTAPTSAPVATPPPFPPAPAISPYTTGWMQPLPVDLNGWVTPATKVSWFCFLYEKQSCIKSLYYAVYTHLSYAISNCVTNYDWSKLLHDALQKTVAPFSALVWGLQLSNIFIIT